MPQDAAHRPGIHLRRDKLIVVIPSRESGAASRDSREGMTNLNVSRLKWIALRPAPKGHPAKGHKKGSALWGYDRSWISIILKYIYTKFSMELYNLKYVANSYIL